MKKILLIIFILLSLFIQDKLYATNIVDFSKWWNAISEIKGVSIKEKSGDIEKQITDTWNNVLKTFKIVIWRLLVVYLIYAWVMMILSMWEDEEKLSSSKRSIRYAIVALIFINIPWFLYSSLSGKNTTDDVSSEMWSIGTVYDRNIFMNSQVFWEVIWSILTFMEIAIVALAVIVLIYNWIKLIFAHWDEEVATEVKNKIFYSILWLIFIWVMEVWRNVMFTWDIAWQWQDAFAQIANLALLFARPVAVFFLTLAWYYYITAAWDEEKVTKAKSIVLNTLIATLILIWIYTLLLDIKSLNF